MDRPGEPRIADFEAARLTVRLGAIAANFKTAQRLAGTATAAAVVKADAYGTGMAAVVPALVQAGCDTFFVARLEEGLSLRPLAPQARIFVLDGAQPDAVPALISHRLTPVLNSTGEIAGWCAAARTTRTCLDAAINIDTGMNRLGLPSGELATLAADHAKRLEGIRLVLLMSHLACADDGEAKMNRLQLDRFKTALAMLPPAPASLAATGGMVLGRDYLFDMVRPGVGLYGGNPRPEKPNTFLPAVRLTASILQLRRADKGETVGYGATFRTKRVSLLATAGAGYADGLPRAISNRGAGAIGGVRAPVVGRVSMDLVTLDVTDVPGTIATGMDVEFFGDTIPLEEIASAANTISYEILTSLSHRATRIYEAAP
ncbi:MAG: alanine racemase [Alphaproteobacteria bacterium]|nr:alanine racemase [Alphaproteobacteria bacterium]MDE2629893.1 alanine racemase [Alphaproteobacteria bacterium]